MADVSVMYTRKLDRVEYAKMSGFSLPFALIHPSDPYLVGGVLFVAGICLLYSKDLATCVGGGLLSLGAGLFASGPKHDPDNWMGPAISGVIAVVWIAFVRPVWLRRWLRLRAKKLAQIDDMLAGNSH